ncbi:S26 family signal peptidase [Actinomadura nitritigenes]|uniref:S26 family signal peptidase n=1 Tax=Actinomadura nitritigenes TaxID=134602 RepID=UPI003D92B737
MRLARSAAGTLMAAGLLALAVRRVLIVTTVDGPSMEPGLRSGVRVLVRRTKRARRGQVVLFWAPDGPDGPDGNGPPAGRGGTLLLKRVVAVQGDTLPAGWVEPDVEGIAGTTVPRGCLVVLGDNRPTSWDSRHYGYVSGDRLVGVVIRGLPDDRTDLHLPVPQVPSSMNLPHRMGGGGVTPIGGGW